MNTRPVESEQRRVKKLAWELRSVVEWQEAERARSHPANILDPLIASSSPSRERRKRLQQPVLSYLAPSKAYSRGHG